MKQEIKERFLKALRGGEYKQTQVVCKDEQGCFCFTGVLLDLASKDGIGTWDYKFGRNFLIDSTGYSNVSLSEEVVSWAGLEKKYKENDENVLCYLDDKTNDLEVYWAANDRGMTLAELADIVEKCGIFC